MTSREFCYWLQGYFEITGGASELAPGQVQMIKNHLNLVFKHDIDPSAGSAEHQQELQDIHDAGKPPYPVKPGNILVRC